MDIPADLSIAPDEDEEARLGVTLNIAYHPMSGQRVAAVAVSQLDYPDFTRVVIRFHMDVVVVARRPELSGTIPVVHGAREAQST